MESLLTEKHHALLFGLLARQCLQVDADKVRPIIRPTGQPGAEAVVLETVRRYGEQRGHRMRLRALRDHAPLNLTTYLAYKEWRPATPESRGQTLEQDGSVVSTVTACPWANTWQETGLLPYGRFYCQEIDLALGRGFDPQAVLEVKKTLTNDLEPCVFVFHQAGLLGEPDRPSQDATMPWDYHCAHLYKTTREVFGERLGEKGLRLARAALDEFAHIVGEAEVRRILDLQDGDFNQLP